MQTKFKTTTMKFHEQNISSARKVRSINRPEVVIPGVEPLRKPKPLRPNATQRLNEAYKLIDGSINGKQ